MGKKKFAKILFNVVLIAVILAAAGIWYIQPKAIFYPSHDTEAYDALKNDPDCEELSIDSNGTKIGGWFYKNTETSPAPLVILFQGNAQNSSNTVYGMHDIFKTSFDGYNILVIDYPTYGLSEGTLTQQKIFEFANAAFDYAVSREDVNKDKIIIMGFSVGTGVATHLASEKKADGLLLIAPYDELSSLYNERINIFYGPVKFLIRYPMQSNSYAPYVEEVTQIITSSTDEVINCKYAEALLPKFRNAKKLFVVDNVAHNEYFQNPLVLEKIASFLSSRLKAK